MLAASVSNRFDCRDRDLNSMGWMARRASDLACLKGALRTLKMTTPIAKHPTRIFPVIVDELAERHGDAPALVSDRESFSYKELAARANQYARWTLAQGIQKGDTVCLMMPNRPEYMALWLGVTRVGGVVALLNSNLTGITLAHCINVVTPRHIIVTADLMERFETARALVTGDPKLWVHGQTSGGEARIDQAVATFSGGNLGRDETRALTIEDRALFIYTSGTTGMPKAANVNHYRLMLASLGFAGVMDTRAAGFLGSVIGESSEMESAAPWRLSRRGAIRARACLPGCIRTFPESPKSNHRPAINRDPVNSGRSQGWECRNQYFYLGESVRTRRYLARPERSVDPWFSPIVHHI